MSGLNVTQCERGDSGGFVRVQRFDRMAEEFMVWRPESARARNIVVQPQLAAQVRPGALSRPNRILRHLKLPSE